MPEDTTPASTAGGPDPLDEGLARFRDRDLEGAHKAFERAYRKAGNDPRSMSWYGVTLVLVERNSNLGVVYCDQALRLAGPNPELLLNQARVALSLGQRERAVKAVARGLEHWPQDDGLRQANEALGWRRRPVIPFLSRSNPLNRWMGKLRHRWRSRRSPVYELSPISLGMPPRPPGE